MCMPSLNEIRESILELSRTQVKRYGGHGATDVKPTYPRLLSGNIIKCRHKNHQSLNSFDNHNKVLSSGWLNIGKTQAISAREWALCQLTVCLEFHSRSERRSQRLCLANGILK